MVTEIKSEAQIKMETDEDKTEDKQASCTDLEEPNFVPPDDPHQWSLRCMHEIELAALEEVEALEERIFQASLQVKVSK